MSATQRSTMHAIVQTEYGPADTLRFGTTERPAPADNEVLIRVRAAGLDRGTWHLMTGLPYLGRVVFGLRRPKNPVPGMDVSGTVEAVGAKVTRFHEGDQVFGAARGSFAEFAVAREDKLARNPAGLSFQEAAVVAISATTALQALRDAGRVEEGQKVLIIGASGGVGTYAVQLAKAMGAEVTAVASAAKVDLVRSLGADHVIDYTAEDFAERPEHYELILDIGGSSKLSRLRRPLTAKGTLVIVGGERDGRWIGMRRQLGAAVLSLFVRQRLTTFVAKQTHDDLLTLRQFIEAGEVVPVVEKVYRLAEVPHAMAELEAGLVRGKIGIAV